MSKCALCGQVKYPDQEPKMFDQTKRLVTIWWDTTVWVCYECWCMYRVDALLAPVRFMISSNRGYREEDTDEFVVNIDLIEACQQARNALNEYPGHVGTKRMLTDVIERALQLSKQEEL